MKILLIILCGLFGVAQAQTTGYFRYDTTRFQKGGGNNEVYIENGTKALTGGVFTNMGNGLGRWVTPSAVSSDWKLTGNAGTIAGTNFIGTTDSIDFVGKTKGLERFRWNARGALGLGTGTDYGTTGWLLKSNEDVSSPTWVNPETITIPINNLLAATAANVINNTNLSQEWQWNTLANTALKLSATSTAANGNQTLLDISLSGNNALSSQTTYGVSSNNLHGGASGVNVGIYGNAANGAQNVGLQGAASGTGAWAVYGASSGTSDGRGVYGIATATGASNGYGVIGESRGNSGIGVSGNNNSTGYGGFFSNSGAAGTGYGLYAQKFGAATNNYAAYFTAFGGTNNYAIAVPAGGGSVGIGNSTPSALLTLGTAGTQIGTLSVAGNTSGTITIQPQAAAGTYNFNLPTTAGIAGQVLTSGGGGAAAMTWGAGGGSSLTVGTTAIAAGTSGNPLYNNAGVLGEYTTTGTGAVLMKSVSPTTTGTLTGAAATFSGMGLNTTSPAGSYKLDVNGNSIIGRAASSVGAAEVYIYDEASSGFFGLVKRGSAAIGNMSLPANSGEFLNSGGAFGIIAYGASSYVAFGTNGANERMRIDATGNVGIGTITPTSTLQTAGSFATTYTATAVSMTATIAHNVIAVTATGQTITLPTAVGIQGRIYTIKLTAAGTGSVGTTSSQTIDGATTYSLASQYKYVTVQSNNANWNIIGNN